MASAGNGYQRSKKLQRVVDAKKMYISESDVELLGMALSYMEEELPRSSEYHERITKFRSKLKNRTRRIRNAIAKG
jgi:hypothetical protein